MRTFIHTYLRMLYLANMLVCRCHIEVRTCVYCTCIPYVPVWSVDRLALSVMHCKFNISHDLIFEIQLSILTVLAGLYPSRRKSTNISLSYTRNHPTRSEWGTLQLALTIPVYIRTYMCALTLTHTYIQMYTNFRN